MNGYRWIDPKKQAQNDDDGHANELPEFLQQNAAAVRSGCHIPFKYVPQAMFIRTSQTQGFICILIRSAAAAVLKC